MTDDVAERLRLQRRLGRGPRAEEVFGEPDEWMALLVESLLVTGTPRAGEAESLRARAFEAAPASAGSIDGKAFEWIADADSRLGPVLEAAIAGDLGVVRELAHRTQVMRHGELVEQGGIYQRLHQLQYVDLEH